MTVMVELSPTGRRLCAAACDVDWHLEYSPAAGVEIRVVTHCRQHRCRDEFHEHLHFFFHDYASFDLVHCRDYIWFPSGCDLSGEEWRTGEWRYGSWIHR